MPKDVIERNIPEIGNASPDQMQTISQKSCTVLKSLGPQIQWLHSYVTADKIYCVYIAPDQRRFDNMLNKEASRQIAFRKSN